MSDLIVRTAAPEDAGAMAAIALRSRYPEWTEARFARELSLPQTRALVAENGGVAAGFAIGWQVMDELELHLVAVDPHARRGGLARALLAAFEATASQVHLEVAEGNEPALRLYRSLGYSEIGRRPRYYATGETAILMRRIRR